MRVVFYFFLILGFCVGTYLSQDAGEQPQYKDVAKESGPDPLEYYDETPVASANCYAEENHCATDIHYAPKLICVFKKKVGLTNYFGLCAIELQNCLIRQQKRLNDGSASLDDEIYHNGKHFDCNYYGGNLKSEKQAVIWYFKLGALDAEKENITQPFSNLD